GKEFFEIALQVIEEDAAHAAGLSAVLKKEILIAPLFVLWIERKIVAVAGGLVRPLKKDRGLQDRGVRGQIGRAAETGGGPFFQITKVRKIRRYHPPPGRQDQGYA